jgi:succinate dehydrogenase cytochrome b556 subunit
MSFLANASDKKRPEFRNIHISQIVFYRMPPPALVSIMHRVSGALLFLALPLLLWLFELSLTSEITLRTAGRVRRPSAVKAGAARADLVAAASPGGGNPLPHT